MLSSCSKVKKQNDCDTYECRRKSFTITLNPEVIKVGESSTLLVKRDKFYLPKMRVFLGKNLPENGSLEYFEDNDSTASIVLLPESVGIKKIHGIIEEYQSITEDSVYSYQYPFEMELKVMKF